MAISRPVQLFILLVVLVFVGLGVYYIAKGSLTSGQCGAQCFKKVPPRVPDRKEQFEHDYKVSKRAMSDCCGLYANPLLAKTGGCHKRCDRPPEPDEVVPLFRADSVRGTCRTGKC